MCKMSIHVAVAPCSCILLSLLNLLFFASSTWAQSSEGVLGEHLLQRLFHGREKLVSGECEISFFDSTGRQPVHATLSFDLVNSRWRWDWNEEEHAMKYFELDGDSFFYDVHARSITKDVAGRTLSNEEYLPLDPRIIGFTHLAAIQTRMRFDEVKRVTQDSPVLTVERLPDNNYVVTQEYFSTGSGDDEYVQWGRRTLDMERNVPVLFSTGGRLVNTGESATHEQSVTDWVEFDGAFVPVCFEWKHVVANSTFRLDFQWTSVNRPISRDRFDIRSLDLPPNTSIIDTRLGEPVILEIIGQGSAPPDSDSHAPQFRLWMLAMGVVLLAGITLILLRSGRRRAV